MFDGTAFCEHSYFEGDDRKVCIQLYSDEFERCDPLGSKRGKHKLWGVYFSILNLGYKDRIYEGVSKRSETGSTSSQQMAAH